MSTKAARERGLEEADKLAERAEELVGRGEYDEAMQLYKRVLSLQKAELGERDAVVARTLGCMGCAARSQGKFDDAVWLHEQALSIQKEVLGERSSDVALTLTNLSTALSAQGKYSEALPLLRESLLIGKEAAPGERELEVASTLHTTANTLCEQGRAAEAVPMYPVAYAAVKRSLGAQHPNAVFTLANWAAALQKSGDYPEALRRYRDALPLMRAVMGKRHPQVGSTLSNMASALQMVGQHGEATRLLMEAVPLLQESLGGRHPSVANAMGNLSHALHKQGRHAEGTRVANEALALQRASLGQQHPEVATSLHNIAFSLQLRGKYAASASKGEEALDVHKKTFGPNHPVTQNCRAMFKRSRALAVGDAGNAQQWGNDALASGLFRVARDLFSLALDDRDAPPAAERRAELLSSRSVALLGLGMPADALRDAEACAAADPSFADGTQRVADAETAVAARAESERHKERGNEMFKAGDHGAALEAYSAAVEADPKYVAALNNRGLALLKLGRRDDAVTALMLTAQLACGQGDVGLEARTAKRLAGLL